MQRAHCSTEPPQLARAAFADWTLQRTEALREHPISYAWSRLGSERTKSHCFQFRLLLLQGVLHRFIIGLFRHQLRTAVLPF